MLKKRSIRRHHYHRKKRQWERRLCQEKIWGELDRTIEKWGWEWIEKVTAVHANTGKPCSCWMCGNPRRVFSDKLTVQEKRAFQDDGA